MNKKRAILLLKIAIAGALVFFLVKKIDILSVMQNIAGANPWGLFLAFLLITLGVYLSALKWHLLLLNQGVKISLKKSFNIYYIGTFFSSFLPGTISGDAIRGVYLFRETGKKMDTASSIIVERALGVVALLLMSVVFYLLNIGTFRGTILEKIIWVFAAVLATLFALYFFGKKLIFLTRIFHGRLAFVKPILISFATTNSNKKLFLYSFLLSVVFHCLNSLIMYLISLSLGLSISAFLFFVINPIVTVLLMVPISLSGIGVREWAGVTLYPLVGVGATAILAVQIVAFLLVVVNSLIGGVIYIAYQRK